MIRFISDYFRRRRLRPIVVDLPRKLRQRFGGADFYPFDQVDTAAAELNIRSGLMPAAYAVACTPDQFSLAEPDLTTTDYQTVRAEIARLFAFDEWHINCRTLLSASRRAQRQHGEPPPLQQD